MSLAEAHGAEVGGAGTGGQGGATRSRLISAALHETLPRDLRRAAALRRLTLATAMLYRYGEWGSYESSHSTAIFATRLYLGFSRRYRASAPSGLAFSKVRRSGGPSVLIFILRSSAARVQYNQLRAPPCP